MIDRIILGIDPGTNIMGFGLIHQKGDSIAYINMGVLKLGTHADHQKKLKQIFDKTLALIDEYNPDEVAIEAPFHGKNIQSMLKLGRAQGVSMAAALFRSVPIFEYAPRKIKKSIAGSGDASKEQVAKMLERILKLEELPQQMDASDGLAAAVCHYYQRNLTPEGNQYTSWKGFVNKNPGRLSK